MSLTFENGFWIKSGLLNKSRFLEKKNSSVQISSRYSPDLIWFKFGKNQGRIEKINQNLHTLFAIKASEI